MSDLHELNPRPGEEFFIAASGNKNPRKLERDIDSVGLDARIAVLLGSFSLDDNIGNRRKHTGADFCYDPVTKVAGNALGFENDGIFSLVSQRKTLERLSKSVNIILGITILPGEEAKKTIEKLAWTAASLNPAAIEFDISCNNVISPDGSFVEPMCNNSQRTAEIFSVARDTVGPGICLGIKDSPHVDGPESEIRSQEIRGLVTDVAGMCDFVTGINTIGNQHLPRLSASGGRGGLSGPATADVAKEHLVLWKEYAPNLPYLSCGGIDKDNVAMEYQIRRQAGAMLIGGAQEFYRAENPIEVINDWISITRPI